METEEKITKERVTTGVLSKLTIVTVDDKDIQDIVLNVDTFTDSATAEIKLVTKLQVKELIEQLNSVLECMGKFNEAVV